MNTPYGLANGFGLTLSEFFATLELKLAPNGAAWRSHVPFCARVRDSGDVTESQEQPEQSLTGSEVEHREPTVATVKELYAHAFTCAKPDKQAKVFFSAVAGGGGTRASGRDALTDLRTAAEIETMARGAVHG